MSQQPNPITEVRRTCMHCDGNGYAAVYYSHRVALDLVVDAADAARFSEDEARRLYRLAAHYEDESAKQAVAQPWRSRDSWAAIHRRNAIALRAAADADSPASLETRVVTMDTRITVQASHPSRLSIVTGEALP